MSPSIGSRVGTGVGVGVGVGSGVGVGVGVSVGSGVGTAVAVSASFSSGTFTETVSEPGFASAVGCEPVSADLAVSPHAKAATSIRPISPMQSKCFQFILDPPNDCIINRRNDSRFVLL